MNIVSPLGPRTLSGKFVALEPLEERHHAALIEAAADETIWRYFPLDLRQGYAARLPYFVQEMARGAQISFAARRLADDAIVGSTSYLAITPHDAKVEIGATWYVAGAQGSAINPEAKYLLLANAFAANYNRVEFKTDSKNARSRAACASSARPRKARCAVICGCRRAITATPPISRFWRPNGPV